MTDDLTPLSDAELAKLCDPSRCGETMVRCARELVEARKDRARLDWLESHVENLSRISRPMNDTLTLEYVSDISGCVTEEETIQGIRVVIDAAVEANARRMHD